MHIVNRQGLTPVLRQSLRLEGTLGANGVATTERPREVELEYRALAQELITHE